MSEEEANQASAEVATPEWHIWVKGVVKEAESNQQNWHQLGQLMLNVFPTLRDFNMNSGAIGDIIVHGFTEPEIALYFAVLPKKQYGEREDDSTIAIRKKQKYLSTKKIKYLEKLKNAMFPPKKRPIGDLMFSELDEYIASLVSPKKKRNDEGKLSFTCYNFIQMLLKTPTQVTNLPMVTSAVSTPVWISTRRCFSITKLWKQHPKRTSQLPDASRRGVEYLIVRVSLMMQVPKKKMKKKTRLMTIALIVRIARRKSKSLPNNPRLRLLH